jgi:hypothetical protein
LSKKWSEKELSWQCCGQELGAIVQAFIEWRAWLMDTCEPVEVLLDHAKLKYFTQNQNLSNQQECWAAFLSLFHFVIKHIPGCLNPADRSTRRPDYVPPGELEHPQRIMFHPTKGGLHLQGATLEVKDSWIDTREVSSAPPPPAPSVPSVSPPAVSPQFQEPSFCAPLAKLHALLQEAYQVEPPNPKQINDLEFHNGLWWI